MPNQANGPTSPTWGNWSGNLVHQPPKNGENYYFRPTNLADLKAVLAAAKAKGVTLRVSGQRHSQAPLVADDNRGTAWPALTTCLVDMSCYADLGSGKDQIVLGPAQNQVTVNPGVKEDALDAFLTNHKLMLDAVTAVRAIRAGFSIRSTFAICSTSGLSHPEAALDRGVVACRGAGDDLELELRP